MTIENVRELLLLWREANRCQDRIESTHRSGGYAFDLERNLDNKLAQILELFKKEH